MKKCLERKVRESSKISSSNRNGVPMEKSHSFSRSLKTVQLQINPLCLLTLWEAREGMRTGEFPNSFIEVAVL